MADNCPINLSPYDQSGLIRNTNVVNINYTNQDFFSMKSRLISFLLERFGPQGTEMPNAFNDLVESSIAIMLIENWAFLADTLSFKMDQIVNELFIDTVTETENAFRLSKLVGFRPQPPIAARSLWQATMTNPVTTDLQISTPLVVEVASQGTLITIELFPSDSNNNPIFDQDIIIPAGETSVESIVGVEGRTVADTFVGNGEISQTLQLRSGPVTFDSIRVSVEGLLWEQVEFFTDSQPRNEYRVEFDSEYNAFIIFGNNRAGKIPTQGSSIEATYRVGGGIIGNIITDFVDTQRAFPNPGFSVNIPVNFRNYTKGEFGYDGDTIEDVRRKLPAFLRTQNRAVTGEDYKTLAEQFATPFQGKIGKSNAVLRNHGCAGNIIDIYVLALDDTNNLAIASNELKVALNDELVDKKMLTDYICIRNGEIIETDVDIDVSIDRFYRKFEQEFRENITRKISAFFSLNNWQYGKTLKDTELVKSLSDIKEIQGVDVTFTTSDPENSGDVVTTEFYEIIRPDEINISFMYT